MSVFALADIKFKVGSSNPTPSSLCKSLGKKEELGIELIINCQLFNKVLLHNQTSIETHRTGFGELASCWIYRVWHTYKSSWESQGALPEHLSSMHIFYLAFLSYTLFIQISNYKNSYPSGSVNHWFQNTKQLPKSVCILYIKCCRNCI